VPQKFINDVMSAIYSDEYMAGHSLGGTSSKESSKTGLPPEDVVQIIGELLHHFLFRFWECV